MTTTLSLTEARRIWSHRQRLGQGADPTEAPGGWLRSLGGVDPCLALFARNPEIVRQTVDGPLDAAKLWVVPGVRGCIWLVPEADRALALRVSGAALHSVPIL